MALERVAQPLYVVTTTVFLLNYKSETHRHGPDPTPDHIFAAVTTALSWATICLRKVQAWLLVCVLCLIADRVLNVLVPRQLGIVADKLFARESPTTELGVDIALSLLHGQSGVELSQRDAYTTALTEAFFPATFALLATLVAREIQAGRASPGDVVFLVQYWDYLIWPIKYLSKDHRWLVSELVGAERLLDLLLTTPSVTDAPDAITLNPATADGRIEFKNVTSYTPQPQHNQPQHHPNHDPQTLKNITPNRPARPNNRPRRRHRRRQIQPDEPPAAGRTTCPQEPSRSTRTTSAPSRNPRSAAQSAWFP
ncbi:hypothetical protein BP00DRAFT_443785 [Aspergillus indologenus CBS 114.80]|uniref:Uncharacterized protein n=1 Tax=Aspergillus indologenus CBS 114.80 TaxID=1450541 RepID=A0A2V5IK59_9EURO|nr:hypothetical protein BP00DRAFT_443785 [Aspergillus indologenus CBS 114.80]